jgi:hypothetical protein
MIKNIFYLLPVVFVASLSPAYAQSPQPGTTQATQPAPQPGLTQADLKALTDARIGILKAALQLTPDQEKYWPALEEAIRARAQTRAQRIEVVAQRRDQVAQVDQFELLRGRADALTQRGAELRKLADAWQPLFQSLDAGQKRRLQVFAARILPHVMDAIDTHRMEMYDEGAEGNDD